MVAGLPLPRRSWNTYIVSPALASLIALQQIDSAADVARKRLADLPAAEQTLAASLAAAVQAADAVKANIQENQQKRRALEKDVAVVESRLARFDDHKAAVKTNQEYTALLHEIQTAKSDKDAVEERILLLMEEADGLAGELKAAESALKDEKRKADEARAQLGTERTSLEAELARLAAARPGATVGADARTLALYEQLIKGRRGLAVAKMTGEICTACHVRLRPHVTQQIRRNEDIVQCESCQRILYFEATPPAAQEPR